MARRSRRARRIVDTLPGIPEGETLDVGESNADTLEGEVRALEVAVQSLCRQAGHLADQYGVRNDLFHAFSLVAFFVLVSETRLTDCSRLV